MNKSLPERSGIILVLTCGAVLLAYLDTTVVNVAFPAMRATFPHSSVAVLSWVVSVYAILFGAALVPAGRLADVVGRKPLYLTATVGFALASAACALAPNLPVLVGARAVQGLFAGGMIPSALGLLLAYSQPQRRVLALGIWGATGAFASAAGPALGGMLVESLHWRAVFLINLPLGLLLAVCGARVLPADERHTRTLPDLLGSGMLAGGVGLAVLGLSQGEAWGWSAPATLGCLSIGLILILLAVRRSTRHQAPAVDLDLWRNRDFAIANVVACLAVAAMFSWLLSGPLLLTAIWHYSILKASFLVTPGAVMASIVAICVGRLQKPRAQRLSVPLGMGLFMFNGIGLWAFIGADRNVLAWLGIGLLGGAGLGMSLTGLNTVAALSTPPARFATGSGLHNAARQIGGAFGVAAVAAIISAMGAGEVNAYRAVFLAAGIAGALAGLFGLFFIKDAVQPAVPTSTYTTRELMEEETR